MTLREGSIAYKFRGGIETKEAPEAVPATFLLAAENVVFNRRSSLKKRNGYEELSQVIDGSVTSVTGAIRMASRDSELLEFTPSRCYSRQTGADQWSDTGAVFSVVGSDRPLVKTGTQQTMPDVATLDGVSVAAWEDSRGGVWWSVIDATTGRVFRASAQADALGQAPRCVPCGGNLHVYYAVPTTLSLMILVVNPAAPTATVTPAVLAADLDNTTPTYDACATERPGTPALIAWSEFGSTNIRIGYVDSSGVLGSPTTGHPSVLTFAAARDSTSPIAVAYALVDGADGDRLVLAYVNAGADAKHIRFTGAVVLSADVVVNVAMVDVRRVAVTIVDDGVFTITSAWEEAAAAASNRFVQTTTSNTSGASGVIITVRSVGLATRAFSVNGSAFATFVHDTTFFNTYLTLRLSDFVCVGRLSPAQASGAPTRQHLSSATVSGDVVTFALPVRDRLLSENNDKFRETGLRLFSLDFDSEDSHQAAQLGRGLYMAGACAQHYDGRQWTEQGFHVGPELVATTPAGGGSMTASTTYQYRYAYEWTDAQGEVHRGPTSVGTLVVMAGGQTQVTHTLPTLRVTQKPNVRICVFRSLAAATGSTAQLFRVSSLDPTTSGAANGYVANSTSVDTVSFLDRMSDADLRLQEELYTDGGILSNDPAPLGSVVFRGQSRLFFTDPSNGLALRYSQPVDAGYGLEIPPDLVIDVDPFGGDITAGAFQDGAGLIWKANAIFAFRGDGPAPNGDTSTNGFSTPSLLTSDVGCTDPASIVLTPNGHMFKSAKGIYLIDRGGSVQYVGAPVEAYNAQAVRRANVMPDRTQIVFLTDSGSTLLFDYLFGQWSTFTNHEGLDAAVVGNQYHYLRTDGRVYRETIGSYTDAGVRIRVRLETAWMHMQEHLQGFSRFWYLHLLGTWVSPHQLGIQYQTDYSPQWTDLYWMDATGLSSSAGWITGSNAATIGVDPITGSNYGDGNYGDGNYGGTVPDVYEWRQGLNEKGHSIRFAFEDFEAVGYAGASFELTEMLITGGVKGNAARPWIAARGA